MKIKKFIHPLIDELFKLYGEEAKQKSLELNDLIVKEFKWAINYGYKQVPCHPMYPNRERVNFLKKIDGYSFYFDVCYLKLGLSFNYEDTMLLFNGDGEYDKEIRLDYTVLINDTDDIEQLERDLIKKFLNEVNKLFFLKNINKHLTNK